MDRPDLQDEYDREDEEARREVYGNEEARRIVDALIARWPEFTSLPAEPEYLNAVIDEVLPSVDSALREPGTPRDQIPALAERWFRDAVKRLEG